MSSSSSTHSTKRPRGLLATRKPHVPVPREPTGQGQLDGLSSDEEDEFNFFAYRKRSRCSETPPSDVEEVEYRDYSRQIARPKVTPLADAEMTTTSTAIRGSPKVAATCTYKDWQRLQLLFAEAAEENDRENNRGALPLLRAVIHECHRFLLFHDDPSILFCTPTTVGATQPWNVDPEMVPENPEEEIMPHELPTAFHALFGTTLFLFGNLISQDPTMTLAPEPESPMPYWLAALDIFETGEISSYNLSRVGDDSREDWGMAITWGRCLVCIADEMITRSTQSEEAWDYIEPMWPKDSPFATIAQCRPPVTRRMSLFCQTPHDLMTIAMDFFCRGIFHMPHASHRPASGTPGSGTAPPTPTFFSRPTELYKIASEVLAVAERMDIVTERQYWAAWADSVFNQMKMEADMDKWRARITRARGRSWLIIGCAHLEMLEAALEEGKDEILSTPEAEESRAALRNAIDFFDRAKGSATSECEGGADSQTLRSMLAEALVNLANLTPDESTREELYARAEAEDSDIDLDSRMDTTD